MIYAIRYIYKDVQIDIYNICIIYNNNNNNNKLFFQHVEIVASLIS